LSGSQFVISQTNPDIIGWWDELVGDNKCIDTNKYYVICANVLGSCFGSTSPLSVDRDTKQEYRLKFPVITIKDMVKANKKCFSRLGLTKVKAIIGASMGGMQALQFAVDYPNFAENIISIASTTKTQDYTIAFNKVNSEAIIKDPAFENGNYDKNKMQKNGFGLAIARMVGHISFLSRSSMKKKFKNEYVGNDGLYDLFGRFQVDRYLEYNAYNFVKKFDVLSYLYLLKAINIFDLSRGYDSISEALSCVKSNLYLLSYKVDLMFDSSEQKIIKDNFVDKDNKCEFVEIDSDYGHDSFLVEVDIITPYIKKWIEK